MNVYIVWDKSREEHGEIAELLDIFVSKDDAEVFLRDSPLCPIMEDEGAIERREVKGGRQIRTLTIVPQPAPEAVPDLDMQGAVCSTALVIPKRGEQFYVCNPMDEIIEARSTGEPFIAHAVVGMQAKRAIIEPGTIARIQEV